MNDTRTPSPWLPAAACRLAAAWILVGALFKLLLGTPNDLPPVILELALPLSRGALYRTLVAIELVVVSAAFLRPRLAWPLVVATYLAFEAVLGALLVQGVESCGCMGSKVTITPATMMTLDTVLLVALLAARPWRITARGAPLLVLAAVCAVAAALPWLLDREVKGPRDGSGPAGTEGRERGVLPEFVDFPLADWEGELVYDTPIAGWLEEDVSTLPSEGLWVLWRSQCDHCATHLEEMVRTPPLVEFLTLVRVPEPNDGPENRAVHFMPEGPHVVHAKLDPSVEYSVLTPAEIELEEGVIVRAEEGVETEVHGE